MLTTIQLRRVCPLPSDGIALKNAEPFLRNSWRREDTKDETQSIFDSPSVFSTKMSASPNVRTLWPTVALIFFDEDTNIAQTPPFVYFLYFKQD